MEKTPISLVIITLNEQSNIERCIRSVPFADDIVVLDSGSTDRTVEIARSLGARTFIEPFRGYQKQKVRATSLARHPWVLSLDADEGLSVEAQQELQEILSKPLDFEAYESPRLSFHLGRWIHHGGWYPDRQIRFFNKEKAKWREGNLHERIEASNVCRLKCDLHHWVFKDLADNVDTNNEYSTLGARDQFEAGKNYSIFKLLLKPISKFLETYILKRGFLDGMPGFIIAVGASYSMFLKFAKLWEMQKIKNNKTS